MENPAAGDLFPFILELALELEKFNNRYRKRQVRVLRIAIREGVLEFTLPRQVPTLEKRIAAARLRIRQYRKEIRKNYLSRARAIPSTARFESLLLPEWKQTMPDERETLFRMLQIAERSARCPDDWKMLARWYRYGRNTDEEARCLAQSAEKKSK